NFSTISRSSLTEIPTIARSLPPYFLYNLSSAVASARHGGHQVVQKSRRTVFPLRADKVTGSLFRSVTVKSGAALPASSFFIFAAFHGDSSFTSWKSSDGGLNRPTSAGAP